MTASLWGTHPIVFPAEGSDRDDLSHCLATRRIALVDISVVSSNPTGPIPSNSLPSLTARSDSGWEVVSSKAE
jgi:hypothetical protein